MIGGGCGAVPTAATGVHLGARRMPRRPVPIAATGTHRGVHRGTRRRVARLQRRRPGATAAPDSSDVAAVCVLACEPNARLERANAAAEATTAVARGRAPDGVDEPARPRPMLTGCAASTWCRSTGREWR